MNFPTWLPTAVAEYTTQSLLTPNSEDCEIALKTLTTDERMRGAWETLKTHAKSERDLTNYLWDVCNVLGYWNGMGDYGLLITPKVRILVIPITRSGFIRSPDPPNAMS